MAAQGYSGKGSFVFYIDEAAGYGKGGTGGTLATPVNPVSGDIHVPLNSLTEISFDLPKYTTYEEVLMGDSIPTRQSKTLEAGALTVSGVYHAPFLMSRFFSAASDDGTWTLDPETLSMAMTNWETTANSVAFHVHIENRDSSKDDIDLNLFGGAMSEYSWAIETDDVLKEEAVFAFNQSQVGAIAFNTAATFHNGKFAMWNEDRIINSNEVLAVTQQKITVSTIAALDAAIASYSSAKITLKTEYAQETGLGYEQTNFNEKKSYDVEATLTVKPNDDLAIEQVLLRIENRQSITYKMLITEGTRSEYIQCTEMRLDEIGSVAIPAANGDAVMGLELTFKATAESALTYVGTFDGTSVPRPVGYVRGIV